MSNQYKFIEFKWDINVNFAVWKQIDKKNSRCFTKRPRRCTTEGSAGWNEGGNNICNQGKCDFGFVSCQGVFECISSKTSRLYNERCNA